MTSRDKDFKGVLVLRCLFRICIINLIAALSDSLFHHQKPQNVMNYVRHLNAFVKHAQLHPDWDAFHLSMYYVLFHVWNYKQFRPIFKVSRDILMRASRIRSFKKYYECLKGLHKSGMIVYYPAHGMKQLATIGMIELFEPKEKTAALFCKPDDDAIAEEGAVGVPDEGQECVINNTEGVSYIPRECAINNTGGVSHIPQECAINNTWGVLHITRGDAINNTGSVLSIPQPDSINATDSVLQIPHSLKQKQIKDLKSVCANGRSPMGNNNFPFFSSPGTAGLPPGNVQEVSDYFLQQGYPLVEAANFFDYYAVTGWKTRSGAPVVNWQCAARRWMTTAASQQRIAINTLKHVRDQHLHTSDDKDYSEPL